MTSEYVSRCLTSLVILEMQIENSVKNANWTPMRYHIPPAKITKIKETWDNIKWVWGFRVTLISYMLGMYKMAQAFWEWFGCLL